MWKLWIDTGGTFTDCIAQAPDGTFHRAKVLSRGGLRGHIIRKINPHVYEFEAPWAYESTLLEGYQFKIRDGGESSRLLSINYESKTITIEDNLPTLTGRTFEISSGEEAPVLAARLVTRTRLDHPFPALEMRLGTTKGTNALLERKGAKTLLIVSKGFKDLLRIGTQQRPDLFQLHIPEPVLLYDQVIEAEERLDAGGKVIEAIDTEDLSRKLAGKKYESAAVSFLHSYLNPVHEELAGELLKKSGHRFVSLSSRLFSSIHYLRRTQTAVVNAYLTPVITRYLENIRKSLGGYPLKVMTSAGGLVDSRHFPAKDSLLSGPAGGMVAATDLAAKLGLPRVITFDMGGTSTDVARIDRHPELKYLTRIDGIELHNPSLAIETVAAGGGSICWFDGYTLQVGPESAGALPGPACYGVGGPLTLTDVNILLGKLDPSKFGIPIKYEAAERALTRLKNEIFEKTGNTLSSGDILSGLERIANEKMADAIRRISVAKGINPCDYALVVFGGAGGLHGCQLADILGMETVVLPFDGGLFSAWGMGKARVQRIISEQLLLPWEKAAPLLPGLVVEMTDRGAAALRAEGITETETGFCSVFLRFAGQENTLEIPYTGGDTLAAFRESYITQFGYYPEDKTVELESIRLMVTEAPPQTTVRPAVTTGRPAAAASFIQTVAYDRRKLDIAVFDWDAVQPGEAIAGPAILINSSSTTFVPAGWQAVIQENKDAVAVHQPSGSSAVQLQHTRETELELYINRFKSIAEEMGAQLRRTAFSVNVKERLDFSCALVDAAGDLLVNAPHIPVHLGSLGICTRLVREKIDLGPGDVVITNHPAYGGSHLPDVTLLMAVFTADRQLIGYVVNRAHHAEIGGKSPGSMPPDATSLSEEGVVIAPQYLMKNGVMQWDAIRACFSGGEFPTRSYTENEADIIAALSALQKGSRQLLELVALHGADNVRKYMSLLKEKAFALLNESMAPYLDKHLKATEFLDDGHRIQVCIRFTEEAFIFDFSGTSAAHPHNLNANKSILYSCILYVLRLLTQKDIPLNEGMMRHVEIILPDNSLLHPVFDDDPRKCPAVVGGNTEISQRLTDTLLKAFGLAACSQGTMNNFLFGNDAFGYYETIGGGTGAGPGFHGRSGVHQHMTNTRITDAEELERKYPVRLLQFGLREGSGGTGAHHGGDGIIRSFEFLAPLDITVISQHRNFSPYGMAGGSPGKSGRNILVLRNGKVCVLPGIFNARVTSGDRLIIETPGGGGYGE